MNPDFLPSSAESIQDPDAIALLQTLQRQVVPVEFGQTPLPIATAYVRSAPQSTSDTTPILLLHGFDSSLLEFRRLIPRLAEEYETWALDLYGAGFTEYRSSFTATPAHIRQHLLDAIATLIQQPVIVVGASLGGAVAIDFTLHHPDWVQALVLIDSVGFSGGFPVGEFLPQPLIEVGADWLYFRKRAALALLTGLNADLAETLRCSLLHQEMPGWKAAITAFTQSGGYANLSDRLSELKPPTLILWGEFDSVLGTGDAHKFNQAIPRSQLVWILRAGHAPHLEQPQALAEHLMTFAQHHSATLST